MAEVRCPYCHQYIDKSDYPAHERRHRKARSDGQQTDYATLPEEERRVGGHRRRAHGVRPSEVR